MPTYQTAANVSVVIARETTAGTAAASTLTTARVMRVTASEGLKLNRAVIESAEKRDDGNKAMGRLGWKAVDGTYGHELSVGGAFSLLTESIMRAAYSTSVVIGFASLTTVAIGTNQVVATGGDWVGGQGLRVGDIFTVTGTTTSGNNNLRVPIVAITSLTISVPAGTFTTLAATSTGTITRLRKLVNGSTPTSTSYTVEQYDETIDLSEYFVGCKLTGLSLSLKPGQMATAQTSWMGMDRTALATGTSPYFSGQPAVTTGLSLVADDSGIYKSGVAVANFTGFDLNFQIQAAAAQVIGQQAPAGIFDNDLVVSGTITGLRSDFANLTSYDAETEFDLQILLTEPTTAPKPCIGLYLPRVKIAGLSAPFAGDDGAKVETLTLMIGPKVAATGYDATVALWAQSTE